MAVLLMCGCTHKDITCPAGDPTGITVLFDWSRADKAEPEGMTLYFYPISSGGLNWRFDIAGRDGGKIELPAGSYRMLAVNNDLPGVAMTGDSFGTLSAKARPDGSDQGRVRPTGMLYAARVDHIEVTPCGVTYLTQQGTVKECPAGVVRCSPDSIATQYHITVDVVSGMEHLRGATLLLEGVATSKAIASGSASGSATVAAQAQVSRASTGTLHAVTTGLGSPDKDGRMMLTVSVTRSDGKTFRKTYDVSDQVMSSSSARNVYIYIHGLEIPTGDIPDTPGEDVGLVVGVDGWDEVEIYL